MAATTRTYLDYNASAPLLGDARAAMLAVLDRPGNASSVHREGQFQRRAIDTARRAVATLAGAQPDNVIFTSGSTEAAASLLTPNWTVGRTPYRFARLLVGATEHPALMSGGSFAEADKMIIPVDANGLVQMDALKAALSATGPDDHTLVAIQIANNETGVIQDVSALAQVIHDAGAFWIADATQAAGRIPLAVSGAAAPDAIILSGHKIGGPKGVGAIVHGGEIMRPRPLIAGGGQEKGFRGGTENAPAIAGFGAAASAALSGLTTRSGIASLRNGFEAALGEIAPDCVIHGVTVSRLDNTCFFSVPGIKAETAMIALDLDGIAVSAGSACSSGKVGRSAVLTAMGYDSAEGALRVSFGPDNRQNEVERLVSALSRIVGRRKV